jgi:hypothetical protein
VWLYEQDEWIILRISKFELPLYLIIFKLHKYLKRLNKKIFFLFLFGYGIYSVEMKYKLYFL